MIVLQHFPMLKSFGVTGLALLVFATTGSQKTESNLLPQPATGVAKAGAPAIGASFSIWYARWLSGDWGGPGVGPGWRESLEEILRLGVKPIRLSLQWNEVERRAGEYDWSEIEEAVGRCAKRQAPVILCLGAKTPRWPEVHLPSHYRDRATSAGKEAKPPDLNTDLDSGIGKELLAFIKAIATRYGNDRRISMFQVENEPLEPFGDPPRSVALTFLGREVATIRKMTKKPLAVTFGAGLTGDLASMKGRRQRILKDLLTLPVNMVGLDVYQRGLVRQFGILTTEFNASGEHWQIAGQFINQIRKAGKRPLIAELQFEPWEEDAGKVNFRNPRANRSLKPEDLPNIWKRAKALGAESVLLWGLEFQVACHQQGNKAWLATTKSLLKQYSRSH